MFLCSRCLHHPINEFKSLKTHNEQAPSDLPLIQSKLYQLIETLAIESQAKKTQVNSGKLMKPHIYSTHMAVSVVHAAADSYGNLLISYESCITCI